MTADLQPILTGPTIELTPTVPRDWGALFAVASDPEIWAVHPAHDRWQEPVFRRYFDDALASGGGLTIRERATGRIIGASRYRLDPADPGRCEIGWTFLSREFWGGATNRELKALMLRHLFTFAPVAVFVVGAGNLRSRRAMEKIGGRLTDVVETRMMAGVPMDHVIYEMTQDASLLATEWPDQISRITT